MHSDINLPEVARHRRAHELSAKAVLPWGSTFEKAQEVYGKELTKLHAQLDAPAVEFSEIQIAEARSKIFASFRIVAGPTRAQSEPMPQE